MVNNMVKLAQTIGATGIAQGTRQMANFGSSVIEVRQNLYDDKQQKNAVRVFPFSDIQYAGAEIASKNSIIASCHVPVVCSVDVRNDNYSQLKRAPIWSLDDFRNETNDGKYMSMGFGMADYLFGVSQSQSKSSITGADFDESRRDLYTADKAATGFFAASVDGTSALKIKQYLTESEALDEITAQPARMIIGYVIGPRDVKLYYTETAIGMMVRRMRRIVEALGPYKPQYYPIGLGHLANSSGGKPWTPRKKGTARAAKAKVVEPGTRWSAGAVQYKNRALKAEGTMYIPQDQVPYGTRRRNFKYNHIMTQLGLELMETFQAIGIDLNNSLQGVPSGKQAYTDQNASTQVAALQMLFTSMFGSSPSTSTTNDFTVDEASVAAAIKDKLGMMFNSGHIHIDPGVFAYTRTGNAGLFTEPDGRLSTSVDGLKFKGESMSPAGIMNEFISRYVSFIVAATCLESYMTVPLYECHWLYVGSPKPEYVTEQLQMNFRSDVYFDGDNSSPFTLIPTELNPGQVLSRVPCYLDCDPDSQINTYLGIRDPLPYGNVIDIRFAGDRPLTTTEESDYTFTPIIEADSSVQTQYRNHRTVNCAVWPRPTHYAPGATRIAGIYGLMTDNTSVGGHYYYVPQTGTLINDNVELDDPKIFRAMKNNRQESELVSKQLMQGMTKEATDQQRAYWKDHEISEKENPQTTVEQGETDPLPVNQVFPGTTSGRRAP
jgi:hypothetical protein